MSDNLLDALNGSNVISGQSVAQLTMIQGHLDQLQSSLNSLAACCEASKPPETYAGLPLTDFELGATPEEIDKRCLSANWVFAQVVQGWTDLIAEDIPALVSFGWKLSKIIAKIANPKFAYFNLPLLLGQYILSTPDLSRMLTLAWSNEAAIVRGVYSAQTVEDAIAAFFVTARNPSELAVVAASVTLELMDYVYRKDSYIPDSFVPRIVCVVVADNPLIETSFDATDYGQIVIGSAQGQVSATVQGYELVESGQSFGFRSASQSTPSVYYALSFEWIVTAQNSYRCGVSVDEESGSQLAYIDLASLSGPVNVTIQASVYPDNLLVTFYRSGDADTGVVRKLRLTETAGGGE